MIALENQDSSMQTDESKAQDKGRDVKRNAKAKKKEEAKAKKRKKVVAILLLVVILFGSLMGLDMQVYANQQEQARKTAKTIYEKLGVDNLLDIIEIKGDEQNGYYYDFVDGTDEKLDELVKTMKTNGSKAITKKLLKKMIKAEVINQCPFLKGAGNMSSASGNSVAEKTWNFLIGQGFSEISVAGAMGNIHHESGGFNPDIVENGGSGQGIGLCQWSGDRRVQLETYARETGRPWQDLDVQLEFLLMELQGGSEYAGDGFNGNQQERERWENATTVEESAIAFEVGFERAQVQALETRTFWANYYYEAFQGTYSNSQTEDDGTIQGEFSGTVRIRRVTPNKNIGQVKNTGTGSVTDTTSSDFNTGGAQIQEYINNNATSGTWSVYAKNLTSNSVKVNINNQKLKSASLIKLFIMAAAFEKIETEDLERNDVIEDIKIMINRSDNDAANRLIDALGFDAINSYILGIGSTSTEINRKMLESADNGDNYTSVMDVGNLLEKMYRGTCVSQRASQEMIDILKTQTLKSKIPAGVPSDIETANKTGELSDVENDAAIIYKPNAHYILVVMSNDLSDTQAARNNIKEISSQVYEQINASNENQMDAPHKVAIVAGHGDPSNAGTYEEIANRTKWYTTGTSGTTPSGETWHEWEITKKVADYVEQYLSSYSNQVSVVQVGYSQPNWERMQLAQDQGVDSYIGIHFNSSQDASASRCISLF